MPKKIYRIGRPTDAKIRYKQHRIWDSPKGFTIANARIGVDAGARWEAAVFCNNIFNKIGETDLPTAISADLPTTRRYAINQPRTIGASLTFRY